jgi:excisionase family DNA binding protein
MSDYTKPLYSLTVGEYVELTKNTMISALKEQEIKPEIKPDQEEHFTIRECAAFLHCSVVSIHNYKKQGMPYYRIGRKVLFKKSEVLEFMGASKLRINHRGNTLLRKAA